MVYLGVCAPTLGRGAPLAPPTCFSQGRVMKSTCSSATLLSTFAFPNGKGSMTLVGEFFKAKFVVAVLTTPDRN